MSRWDCHWMCVLIENVVSLTVYDVDTKALSM